MPTLMLHLASLALLLNALVPAGFMLHPLGDGGLTWVLCPDQGALPVAGEHAAHARDAGNSMPPQTSAVDDQSCTFSAAGGPLLGAHGFPALFAGGGAQLLPRPDAVVAPVRPFSLFAVRAPPFVS